MTETHHSEVGRTRRWQWSVKYPRRARRPSLESLESRSLLSSLTVTEYGPLLSGSQSAQPVNIAVGSDGNLWFTEGAGNQVGMINPTAPTNTPTTFSKGLPTGADLDGITTGPDGNLWFTETIGNAIGMINPTAPNTQTIQNVVGTPGFMISATSAPAGITSADGALWFTQALSDQIGRLDPNTHQITEYSNDPTNNLLLPMKNLDSKIILGPDGDLWFTEYGYIGIFDPTTGKMVQDVPLPGGTREEPFGIALGPDGNVWYTAGVLNAGGTAYVSYAVGVIKSTGVTETPITSASEPFGIAGGPDGNLWFTVTANSVAGTLDAIDPATGMIVQTLSMPTNVVAKADPVSIVGAPDGNLWFADGAGAVGVVKTEVTPHFVVTTAPPSPVTAGSPFDLAVTAEYGSSIVDTEFNGTADTATLYLNSTAVATVPAVQGVATFSNLTLTKAGAYTFQVARSASSPPTATSVSDFNVVAAAATQLFVTSPPPGSVPAGGTFSVTVAALDPYDNLATSFNGTVIASLFVNAGGAGTLLSGSTASISSTGATPGYATFNVLSLNNVGNGYQLGFSSSPTLSPTVTGQFNVTTAIPPTIMAEQPVYFQKTNKKGKHVGKKLLTGYTITYSTAMNQVAIGTPTNYQVEVLKKFVKQRVPGTKQKIKVPVYNQIVVTVPTQLLTSTSATLMLPGKPGSQKFPKGGKIIVIAAPPGGVDDSSGIFLTQNGVLAISAGGNTISLQS